MQTTPRLFVPPNSTSLSLPCPHHMAMFSMLFPAQENIPFRLYVVRKTERSGQLFNEEELKELHVLTTLYVNKPIVLVRPHIVGYVRNMGEVNGVEYLSESEYKALGLINDGFKKHLLLGTRSFSISATIRSNGPTTEPDSDDETPLEAGQQ